MNNLTEQILQAVEIIADEKISKLEYDKTVKATIFSVVNLDIGEYKVRYNGNIFSAFSTDVKVAYKIGDSVYVIIPEGKLSNKKMITGLVTNQSLNSSQLTQLQNSIFERSPDFNSLYGGLYDSEASYGVIAGIPYGRPNSYNNIYNGPELFQSNGFHGLFQQYANNYEIIRIKASFLTQFHSVHNKGNYGLYVEFYAKGKNNTVDIVSYKLDLNSFNGDPYHLSVYSPQWAIIKTQKNYLLGLKSIRLFEEDFEYDKLVENGQITNKLNTTQPNIFVKDISIQYVEQIDLSNTNYYLMISAPKGIALTSNISSLDLTGRLIYQGKDIMDSNCKCKWFVRDLTVMIGEEDYDKKAGFGWRPLSSTQSTITINETDIRHEQKYKLLVDYNDVSLSAEIKVFNHNSEYSYIIEQHTNGADINLQLINNQNSKSLIGDWFLSYPDGSYNSIEEGKKKNSISISKYLKYSAVTFYCQIYDYNNRYIIGTLEHTIMNSESDTDVTINYVGEDTFRYDANGDIAIEDSEKERTLQVNLTWKEGFGTAYTVQWLAYNSAGREVPITNNPDNNKIDQSMIDKIWVDNYNILHYTIKQKYKINFQNNILAVKITTITGQEYLFDKEILFLKDGDQGTNGTTFVVAVRPYSISTGLKLSGFQPLIYNGGWGSGLPLRCYVYKDGELINQNLNFSIKYRWNGINISFTQHDSGNIYQLVGTTDRVTANGTTTINTSTSSQNLQFYVKVQVTINDKMNNRETQVYASYPIDVAVGGINTSSVDIDTIPSYIKYTSSGITPQFYNNDINFLYNGAKKNDSIISLNKNILDVDGPKDGLYYLRPATNFIFENIKNNNESNIGILKCSYSSTQYIIHPIIMYLDTYGNEAINGWDGTALDTGDNSYVFAPQIGAGVKDSANRFTGVVMGKDSGQDKVGLYGYQSGNCTFGLMQDGKAFFGSKSGGGQIEIDGTSAVIKGGNGGDSTIGMTITLANLNPERTTNAIKVGGGVFKVTYDGALTATSADIQGIIYAQSGIIGCDTNKHGGWIIEANRLYSGSGVTRVELNSDQSTEFAIWAGSNSPSSGKFAVKRNGYLYASDAQVKGEIEADKLIANREGSIAGWAITTNKLYNGSVGIASQGNAAFWAGENLSDSSNSISENDTSTKFLVTRSGKLYCSSATIRGKIIADSGEIAGWKIGSDGFSKTVDSGNAGTGNYYLSATRGIKWGDNFQINSSGNVIVSGKITSREGNIGGWRITSQGLYYYANGTDSESEATYESRATFRLSTSGSGALYIGTGADLGYDNSYDGSSYLRYSNGNLSVSGVIRASSLQVDDGGWGQSNYKDILGKSANGTEGTHTQIQSQFLNVKGLTVTDYSGQTTFSIDQDGNVSVAGDIIMSPNSTISWSNIQGQYGEPSGADVVNSVSQIQDTKATLDDLTTTGYDGVTMIKSDRITVSRIDTGVLSLLNGFGVSAGQIILSAATSGAYAIQIKSNAALRLIAEDGSAFLGSGTACGIECRANGEVEITTTPDKFLIGGQPLSSLIGQ